jgi:hypothetical protein
MNIRDYIQDILNDLEYYRTKDDEFIEFTREVEKKKLKKSIVYRIYATFNPKVFPSSNGGISTGIFGLLFPHFLGAILGCAFARIFTLHFSGYVIFGLVFAVLVGTYKSHESDKITWKHAFIKNSIIIGIFIMFALTLLIIFNIFQQEFPHF